MITKAFSHKELFTSNAKNINGDHSLFVIPVGRLVRPVSKSSANSYVIEYSVFTTHEWTVSDKFIHAVSTNVFIHTDMTLFIELETPTQHPKLNVMLYGFLINDTDIKKVSPPRSYDPDVIYSTTLPSDSDPTKTYQIDVLSDFTTRCTCPGWVYRGKCKHQSNPDITKYIITLA